MRLQRCAARWLWPGRDGPDVSRRDWTGRGPAPAEAVGTAALSSGSLDRSKNSANVVRCAPSDDSPSVLSCLAALAALGDLAGNLRWSWHPETQDVFRALDPDLWESTGHDPVRLLGAVGRARLERARRATSAFLEQVRAARADLEAYLTGDRWYQQQGRRRRAPRDRLLLPGVRHHRGAPAVLRRPRHPRRRPPQGRQRPRRPDHRRRPALPPRLLQAGVLPRGLAAGDLPGPRPRRPADLAAARGRRLARHDLDRDARRPRPGGPDLGRQRRPGAAAAARHRRRGQPRPLRRRHRPPLRRQQRAPAAPGAAARRRRRPRAARLLADHRSPRARGVPHQRGPRRLPRPRADPRAHRRRGAARASTSTPRSRSAAPPPSSPPTPRCRPASTGSRATLVEQYFGETGADPPASRSTGSWRSAPRTTRAATPASSTWR